MSEKAIFVCFGCLSNLGRLTGVAALEVVDEIGVEKANIFCLGALATGGKIVIEKTKNAEKIVVVDGCSLSCAKKIVEGAGFSPDAAINLMEDLGMTKGKPLDYTREDVLKVKEAIKKALG
jgi:uncharacterized metal-binding protein